MNGSKNIKKWRINWDGLDATLEIIWLLLLIILPTFFLPFIFSPFQTEKIFIFILFLCLLYGIWLFKIFFKPKPLLPSPDNRQKNRRPIQDLAPGILLIFFLFLSSYFSDNFSLSFEGSFLRSMGLFFWLLCFLFFVFLYFNLKTKKQVERINWAIVISTFLVSAYGILQFFNISGSFIFSTDQMAGRVYSTIGQPNFLASWLLLTLPFVVWQFFHAKTIRINFIQKIFCVLTLLFSLFTLWTTQSRGGIIGIIMGSLFFSFLFCWRTNKKIFYTLLIFLGIVAILLLVSHYAHLLPARFEIDNLKTAAELRFFIWDKAWALIQDRPFLGYGPDMQFFPMMTQYSPIMGVLESIRVVYLDRAHNIALDQLLFGGVFGFLSFLYLLGSAFWRGLKAIKIDTEKYYFFLICLMTGAVSYLASLQFSFFEIVDLAYLWAYLAILYKWKKLAD